MSGFAGRGKSYATHDELNATALVLSPIGVQDPGSVTAIISCDLLFLPRYQVERIRDAVARLMHVRPAHVLVCSSHDHYGPVVDTEGESLVSDADVTTAAYMENLVNVLSGLVYTAARNVVPCIARIGEGAVQIGINRREHTAAGIILGQNPNGPIDPRVRVLEFVSETGRPVAVIVNAACHGVSLGGEFREYSADFPGVMRRVIHTATGATAMFIQGAAGDINPRYMGGDWANPERLGHLLAAEVLDVMLSPKMSAVHVDELGVRVIEKRIELPRKNFSSVDEATEAVRRLAEDVDDPLVDDGERYWRALMLSRAEEGLRSLQDGTPLPTVSADISAVRLSDTVAIATAPGEVFTLLGKDVVDRSPYGFTLFAGYTNGSINYVPTADAFDEGGYEVTHACLVAQGAGELLANEMLELLELSVVR